MRILIASAVVGLALMIPAVAPAQDAPKSKADVEQIVKDYLLKHPEIIIEAVSKYQENQRNDEKLKAEQAISSFDHQLRKDPSSPSGGAPDAKGAITVVEFFDYRCGYCKRMSPLVSKYVAGQKIRLVYKEFPILGPDSVIGSKAALAASKQGDYVPFHQDLMALQGAITMKAVEDLAAKHKLDVAKLKTDMESEEVKTQIKANETLASAIGVSATPSFVIGNELITGAMDDQEFQAALAKVQKH
jgi:protein-disulfide isomerase